MCFGTDQRCTLFLFIIGEALLQVRESELLKFFMKKFFVPGIHPSLPSQIDSEMASCSTGIKPPDN
jgi:hypothetical protein